MIGAALLLFTYMLLAKRSRFLPFLPLGFLIAYFAIGAVSQFVGHFPIVLEYEKWIGVASAIILSWAIIRLTFALRIGYSVGFFANWGLPSGGCKTKFSSIAALSRGDRRRLKRSYLSCKDSSSATRFQKSRRAWGEYWVRDMIK